MQFDEYQAAARKTATYPDLGHNLIYPALGLTGESGEGGDKIKKFWRNGNFPTCPTCGQTKLVSGADLTFDQKDALGKELGDVLWYISNLASELGLPLSAVAEINIAKLRDRATRGVIKSEGDNR